MISELSETWDESLGISITDIHIAGMPGEYSWATMTPRRRGIMQPGTHARYHVYVIQVSEWPRLIYSPALVGLPCATDLILIAMNIGKQITTAASQLWQRLRTVLRPLRLGRNNPARGHHQRPSCRRPCVMESMLAGSQNSELVVQPASIPLNQIKQGPRTTRLRCTETAGIDNLRLAQYPTAAHAAVVANMPSSVMAAQ